MKERNIRKAIQLAQQIPIEDRDPSKPCSQHRLTDTELFANGMPQNIYNENQGPYKRVLCVCMGGLLRSPTLARILTQAPYNCNTRAAGIDPAYSLIDVTPKLLAWADEIVCFEHEHASRLSVMCDELSMMSKPVTCLDIGDWYPYRDGNLLDAIVVKLSVVGFTARIEAYNREHGL